MSDLPWLILGHEVWEWIVQHPADAAVCVWLAGVPVVTGILAGALPHAPEDETYLPDFICGLMWPFVFVAAAVAIAYCLVYILSLPTYFAASFLMHNEPISPDNTDAKSKARK